MTPDKAEASGNESSPLFFNRYEMKFMIPTSMVEPISRFTEIYCDLDPYSARSSDSFYKLNSLYFDTPQFYLLRQKLAGQPNRFNMRVRSYGESPTFPYYMEVKRKVRDFVIKRRAKVNEAQWRACRHEIACDTDSESQDLSIHERFGADSNRDLFLQIARTYNTQPQILTQYRRKAYLSNVDEYARVTFDCDMKFFRQQDFSLVPDDKKMVNYDSEDLFDEEGLGVVLELKCTARVPYWMIDLIQTFELEQGGFSKYSSSMTKVLQEELFTPTLLRESSLPFDQPF